MTDSSGDNHPPTQPPPPSTVPPASNPPVDEDQAKWGTHIMGQPSTPTTHPDNQTAASWRAEDQQQRFNQQHPYVVYSPVERSSDNPFESVVNMFNSWSHRAETVAKNIWHNCKLMIYDGVAFLSFLLLPFVFFFFVLIYFGPVSNCFL